MLVGDALRSRFDLQVTAGLIPWAELDDPSVPLLTWLGLGHPV
jgi:hypothetical protein